MVSSTVFTLVVIPAVFALVKGWGLPEEVRDARLATGPGAGPVKPWEGAGALVPTREG